MRSTDRRLVTYFPLHVELSDYHCYDRYFQFAHTVKLSAIIKYALYLSYLWWHFILLFLKIDFDRYGVYLSGC